MIKLFLPHRGVRAGEGKSVPTASNAAYGVVSHDLQSGGGGGDVAMYEMVGQPPSATPTAHSPSDPAYAVNKCILQTLQCCLESCNR